ncbi:MAG TPA: hypothetical protein PKC28_11235 [Bdellovibrionales bacterium]|nr:hypothetical protein [Bdellovibrionales bacterium]
MIEEQALARLRASNKPENEAWPEVIREFHRERYWGFIPDYKKPKKKSEDENLGTRFIWYSFRSFLLTKVVILYCGARYTAGDPNPIYKWLFFGAFAFMIAAYGRFLYKYGNRVEPEDQARPREDGRGPES